MGHHHHHHHHDEEDCGEFHFRTYWRLLRYTRPYWKRLTVGLIAGFLVGGSLFTSLLMLPNLINTVDPTKGKAQTEISVESCRVVDALEKDPAWNTLPRETRLKAVENILHPTAEKDPQLAKMIAKARSAVAQYHLPATVSDTELTITWPAPLVVPIIDDRGNISWQLFAIYAALFVLIWAIKNGATYVNHYCMRWVGTKVVADLREKLFGCLMKQSLRFYGGTDIGQLISRCTNDTAVIENAVADSIADLTRCPVEILACVAAVVVMSIQLGNYVLLVVLLLGMPLVIVPLILLGRRIRNVYRGAFSKIADVFSRMHETFSCFLVVLSYNMEDYEKERFRNANRKYFRQLIRAMRIQLLMDPLMETVAVAATLAFLVYAYSYNITLTALASLMAPAFLAYEPAKKLSRLVTNLQRSMAGADRYFALLDVHTELPVKPDAAKITEFRAGIRFHNVKFGYDDRNILDGIDFTIPKGAMVAVVGETGSGKTTIANLIARFYDVREGDVSIDGVDVRDIDIQSLREHIGIVNQEALLFNETIAANIAYGCPNATRGEIVEAARQANAHSFITDERHPEGYEMVVGEKGCKLSGGEKQRIAIARAILKNPPILILDEATSALDTVTERLVQNALANVMANRTVFAIAHRLSTIQYADLIIVLEHGKIVERGTHEELLKQDGIYKHLYDTQFDQGGRPAGAEAGS